MKGILLLFLKLVILLSIDILEEKVFFLMKPSQMCLRKKMLKKGIKFEKKGKKFLFSDLEKWKGLRSIKQKSQLEVEILLAVKNCFILKKDFKVFPSEKVNLANTIVKERSFYLL
jgi:hypothetical protein